MLELSINLMHNDAMPKYSITITPIAKTDTSELKSINENAINLGKIAQLGIRTLDSFVITSLVFNKFLSVNKLQKKIEDLLSTVHYERADSLMQISNHIKKLILESKFPSDAEQQIFIRYKSYKRFFKKPLLLVGPDKINAESLEDLITIIKYIWLSHFKPKNLLSFHNSNRDIFEGTAILVQKNIPHEKSGKVLTLNSEIQSKYNLSEKEKKEIIKTVEKIKEHFYMPVIIEWTYSKNKLYVLGANPITNAQKSSLVLVRHGESVWNAKGLWTGWTDVELSEKGHEQARDAGLRLEDIHFDIAFTSALKRAQQTLEEIKLAKGQTNLKTIKNQALNERDYGELTGKNKWEVEKQYGEKQFLKWRRGWEDLIPGGESLKDVYHRVIPYYKENILPQLKSGKNVIIAAHGNSLRALAKYIENLSDEEIVKFEIGVGEILVYQINEEGKVVGKEVRN